MPALTAAGPVLVHFLDFAQLNSVRTLPYLVEWDRRYREAGLTTIGVQAPRFPFGADAEHGRRRAWRDLGVELPGRDRRRARALARLRLRGLAQPLPLDDRRRAELVPLRRGRIPAAPRMAIQEELRELDALRSLPEPMDPLRPSDAPGAKVMPPTPELFPGGSWEQPGPAASWSSTTRPAAPTRRSRARAARGRPSTASTRRRRIDGPAPLHARRARAPRGTTQLVLQARSGP